MCEGSERGTREGSEGAVRSEGVSERIAVLGMCVWGEAREGEV